MSKLIRPATQQILTLYSSGMNPIKIAKEVGKEHSNITSTICYYKKRAKNQLCHFTGAPSSNFVFVNGRLLYVSRPIFKLFRAGFMEYFSLVLPKIGYIVVDSTQLTLVNGKSDPTPP